MHNTQEDDYCLDEDLFFEIVSGVDPDTWLTGRAYFDNAAEPWRPSAKFALSHYLFYGDPTRSLPALGYGHDKERNWVMDQIFDERNALLCEPIGKLAQVWRKKVGQCIPVIFDSVSTQQIKASVVALSAFAVAPPSTADWQRLNVFMSDLRHELIRRVNGPERKALVGQEASG
jgi:hypothetical protein